LRIREIVQRLSNRRYPAIKANPSHVEEAESRLDIPALSQLGIEAAGIEEFNSRN